MTGRLAQADALEAHAGPAGAARQTDAVAGQGDVAYMMKIPAGHPVTRLLGLTSRAVRTETIRMGTRPSLSRRRP